MLYVYKSLYITWLELSQDISMYVKAYLDLSVKSFVFFLLFSFWLVHLEAWPEGSWLPWRACALFVVLLLCSCLVLKRLQQEWSCLSFRVLTSTMDSASIKWTCTASLDFSNQDSWLTGPYWPLGRRRKKKPRHLETFQPGPVARTKEANKSQINQDTSKRTLLSWWKALLNCAISRTIPSRRDYKKIELYRELSTVPVSAGVGSGGRFRKVPKIPM